MLTHYRHSAGTVDASFRDAERRYLLIKLKHKAAKGDQLTFTVERQAMETFVGTEEWVETILTQQVARITRSIVFPKGRPCRAATLHHDGQARLLPIVQLSQGRTSVQFEISRPDTGSPYRIHWTW
jgi:hypothetical protein